MPRRLSNEEFIEKVKIVNPNIEVLSEYKTCKEKIKCRCKIHNTENNITADSLLQGKGCRQCGLDKLGDKFRKTHNQFIDEMKVANSDIEILGKYEGNKKKIRARCKIHKREWESRPITLLNGNGCTKCIKEKAADKYKLKHEDFIDRVSENVILKSKYINIKTNIECECKICGYEWITIAESISNGSRCPRCANTARQTTDEIISRLKYENPYVELVGERRGYDDKSKFKCKVCEETFEATLNHVLSGHGCKCNKISVGEIKIKGMLDKHEIKYIREYTFEDCRKVFPLPFDFYIPEMNVAVEYDGIQHYKPIEFFGGRDAFIQTKNRDKIKTDYCNENNIRLIRIPYTEKDIELTLMNGLLKT